MNTNGWVNDPDLVQELMNEMPQPFFSGAAPSIVGSGRGKIVLLHEVLEEVLGYFPLRNQGSVGSCFLPTARVLNKDGTLTRIDRVRAGDIVVSHTGKNRKVVNTMSRKFSGDLVTIKSQGWTSLTSTEDHKFPVMRDKAFSWIEAKDIKPNDKVLISSGCKEDSVKQINITDYCSNIRLVEDHDNGYIRYLGSSLDKYINPILELNDVTCYAIGLYVAEGSCDNSKYGTPIRATWTIHEKEYSLLEKLKDFSNQIGSTFSIANNNSSKALNFRINNGVVASFLKNICGKSCNSKEIPHFIMSGTEDQKIAFIRGYCDGDGSYRGKYSTLKKSCDRLNDSCKQIAFVTTSRNLQTQLGILLCSLDFKPTLSVSKKDPDRNYKRRCVYLYKNDAKRIWDSSYKEKNIRLDKCDSGQWRVVKEVTFEKVVDELVYDITVEHDHSFVCDGIATHNCVAVAAALAIDALKAADIKMKGDREKFELQTASEDIYGGSRVQIGKGRVRGDGSLGIWASKYITEYGTVRRQKYGNVDLTKYSESRCRAWGRSGPPKTILEIAKEHPVEQYAQVRSYDEVIDSLANGYPVTIASNVGFNNTRDREGFLRESGSWAHQMAALSFDDKHSRKGVLIVNSWGSRWCSGPKRHNQPDGSFWVDARAIDKMCRQGDSWSYCGIKGYPKRIDGSVMWSW